MAKATSPPGALASASSSRAFSSATSRRHTGRKAVCTTTREREDPRADTSAGPHRKNCSCTVGVAEGNGSRAASRPSRAEPSGCRLPRRRTCEPPAWPEAAPGCVRKAPSVRKRGMRRLKAHSLPSKRSRPRELDVSKVASGHTRDWAKTRL